MNNCPVGGALPRPNRQLVQAAFWLGQRSHGWARPATPDARRHPSVPTFLAGETGSLTIVKIACQGMAKAGGQPHILGAMSRALSFAVFFGILASLSGLAHYYFWIRLVRDLALPDGWSRALLILVAGLGLLIPVSLLGMVVLGRETSRPLLSVAYIWMGLCFLLLTSLALGDLGRGVAQLFRSFVQEAEPADAGRRVLAARVIGVGAATVTIGLALIATRMGLGPVAIKRLQVSLGRLPQAFNGFRIVQISDVHVGHNIGGDFVERIVRQVNELAPDMIAITGDLVDGSVADLERDVAPLAKLRATHGVFFVTGNHDFYSGADSWCAHLKTLNISVLRNEHVTLQRGEACLDIAGVDDYSSTSHPEGPDADVRQACAGRDSSRELILLAHQPRHIRAAEQHQIGLQLSGHTHGGQLWPWNYLVRLAQPFVSGLAKFGATWLYVSNGTGYWGPPMRLGAPAEITEITLRSEGAPEV